jgi:hypothetical protein
MKTSSAGFHFGLYRSRDTSSCKTICHPLEIRVTFLSVMQVAAGIPDTFIVQIFQLQNPPFFFFL